jgi:putative membrane protein
MQVKRIRTVGEVLLWTRRDIYFLLILSSIPALLYHMLGWKWIALPWLPVALIGTALSFIIGFKNNASYDRAWEARKIWGAIVNASRSYVSTLNGFLLSSPLPSNERHEILHRSVKRHIAWLTALRFQLREPRQWESISNVPDHREIRDVQKKYTIEEHDTILTDELKKGLALDEMNLVNKLANKAAQILNLQTAEISHLSQQNLLNPYQQVALQRIISELFDHQGASERIKNFPYPRQYATLNLFYIRIFTFIAPFGMVNEFEKVLGVEYIWLSIPLATLAGWIFTTMEKVGESSENPFEGGANDTPITQISRNIEIDLLDMIGEPHTLEPMQPQFGVLT